MKDENQRFITNQIINRIEVTIGVCVRNSEKLIGEAIQSIIVQDFPHSLMEVIFVDDGSKDRTLSVIDGYLLKLNMQSRMFHHEWKGLAISRNVVVNNAEGRYIIWVDGDMSLSKDFVAKQYEFMQKNPEVAIAKGKYGMCPQNSLVADLENIEFVVTFSMQRGRLSAVPLGTGGSICRVKAMKQVGGFDEKITGSGEDVDAESRIKAAGWSLDVTSAIFYERRRGTWKSLWKEYFWHGQGSPRLFGKGNQGVKPYKLWPPIVLAVESFRIVTAYKLTQRKAVLLLPVHYIFKRTAWLLGFARTLLSKY